MTTEDATRIPWHWLLRYISSDDESAGGTLLDQVAEVLGEDASGQIAAWLAKG